MVNSGNQERNSEGFTQRREAAKKASIPNSLLCALRETGFNRKSRGCVLQGNKGNEDQAVRLFAVLCSFVLKTYVSVPDFLSST